jgi:hypothetical protein
VTDVSGSMAETAKSHIVQMLLCCITGFMETDISFRYFHWNNDIKETDSDAPIHPEGKAILSALTPLWKKETAVLLLTDGFFSLEEAEETSFNQIKCVLKTIAIGGDADEYKLEKLVGRGNV